MIMLVGLVLLMNHEQRVLQKFVIVFGNKCVIVWSNCDTQNFWSCFIHIDHGLRTNYAPKIERIPQYGEG